MVNGALSPNQVPENPYYDRNYSRKVGAPSPVHRVTFHPIKITGKRADEPEGQGGRIVQRAPCTYLAQSFELCLT